VKDGLRPEQKKQRRNKSRGREEEDKYWENNRVRYEAEGEDTELLHKPRSNEIKLSLCF
jgi:hypothetical protein